MHLTQNIDGCIVKGICGIEGEVVEVVIPPPPPPPALLSALAMPKYKASMWMCNTMLLAVKVSSASR